MATPIHHLPIEERLQLVEDLWESIAAEQDRLPLTAEQRAELDARLDEFELDGDVGEPADDVLASLRKIL